MTGIAKIALLIEYEGTGYHGFQVQSNVPTIQEELEKAIQKITGEKIRLHGAGRTDAGVHAKGQVAAFEFASAFSPLSLVRAMNAYLPPDIVVKDACQVEASFNPRRDALSREYRYTIMNGSLPSPFSRRWAYFKPRKLDVSAMNKACEIMKGEHDFASFTNSEGRAKNTIRTVFKTEVRKKNDFISIDMVANAFLPQQVRRTVGYLVEIGSGNMGAGDFYEMINSGRIGLAEHVVPPHGLCLMKVNYSDIGFRNYENI